MTFSVMDQFLQTKQKTPDFSRTKLTMSRGRVRVGVECSVLDIFRSILSHNTGTTRGPHQMPPFLYLILDNNLSVR